MICGAVVIGHTITRGWVLPPKRVICEYCSTEHNKEHCPNCGAPKPEVKPTKESK